MYEEMVEELHWTPDYSNTSDEWNDLKDGKTAPTVAQKSRT